MYFHFETWVVIFCVNMLLFKQPFRAWECLPARGWLNRLFCPAASCPGVKAPAVWMESGLRLSLPLTFSAGFLADRPSASHLCCHGGFLPLASSSFPPFPVFLPILCFFFFLVNLFIYLFIYVWLCWVFTAARGLSLVAVSGGYSSLRCAGFSLRWLLLWSRDSRCSGFSSCGTRAQ